MPWRSAHLIWLVLIGAGSSEARAQSFQIRNGGTPSITGALNGTVLVSGSTSDTLLVSINFGDVAPLNTNAIVRVLVPVLLRSTGPYQLSLSVPASTLGADPNAVRLTDIGLGLTNVRRLENGRICAAPHQVTPPYNTDPALTVVRTGRAFYPATLANVQNSVVVMTGPRLSTRQLNPGGGNPATTDGWAVDLLLTIVPQFFVAGTSSLTVQLEMSSGPNVACP